MFGGCCQASPDKETEVIAEPEESPGVPIEDVVGIWKYASPRSEKPALFHIIDYGKQIQFEEEIGEGLVVAGIVRNMEIELETKDGSYYGAIKLKHLSNGRMLLTNVSNAKEWPMQDTYCTRVKTPEATNA